MFLIPSIYLLTSFKSNDINLLNDYNTYIYMAYMYIVYYGYTVSYVLCRQEINPECLVFMCVIKIIQNIY